MFSLIEDWWRLCTFFDLGRNTAAVQKIRNDFVQELKNMEMARRTKDLPPSLQHDNIAPIKYAEFWVLVEFDVWNLKLNSHLVTLPTLTQLDSDLSRSTSSVEHRHSGLWSRSLYYVIRFRLSKLVKWAILFAYSYSCKDDIASRFFIDMVVEFEGSMQVYRKQIEELENHLNLTEQTTSLTAQG